MPAPIRIISSMATRQVLADLALLYQRSDGHSITTEAVGGVDAAKRVQSGESFDAVVLASKVIDQLIDEGRIVSGSRTDLVRSGVAIAIREGAARPDIGSEEALKAAVLAARSISYSTGPSGVHLVSVFERWGIAQAIQGRMVQAPPGVPVGSLVASGEVELGFQQLSELLHLKGISVLGPLPASIQIITTFSAGLAATSTQPDAVRAMLAFMVSPAMAQAKRDNGMEPA